MERATLCCDIRGSFICRRIPIGDFMDRVTVDQNLRLQEPASHEKRRAWGLRITRNSRGFWLGVCLALSAVAGWLMFYLGILR